MVPATRSQTVLTKAKITENLIRSHYHPTVSYESVNWDVISCMRETSSNCASVIFTETAESLKAIFLTRSVLFLQN